MPVADYSCGFHAALPSAVAAEIEPGTGALALSGFAVVFERGDTTIFTEP